MGKKLFIAEKPSVAAEFAKALKANGAKRNGYMESQDHIITWCVGHLVTMSYPEKYDPRLKRWSMETLPFLPDRFLYEVIPGVKGQFEIVSSLLNRKDVDCIYVCTDSGREGEYIYRLVEMMAGVTGKERRRVWIDSQTEEEILRGIREAKPESAYDNLSASAFLRAKEDYLMGINFSRALTLKYGSLLARATGQKSAVVSAGRVMSCVLGMVVRREREIRDFKKTLFYRVTAACAEEASPKEVLSKDSPPKAALPKDGSQKENPAKKASASETSLFSAEWRVQEKSRYYLSPKLYKENGFLKKEDAEDLIASFEGKMRVLSVSKKKELKNPPLLYNLAELQNDCSRLFKLSPDQTLKIAQELYEKKLTTYPRTDARVLSSAVAKEIHKNIGGLRQFPPLAGFAEEVLAGGNGEKIKKSRYVNDKAITDHYAIIPTGQGFLALRSLNSLSLKVYELICRRFLSIFYPPAEYSKVSVVLEAVLKEGFSDTECFYANFKTLKQEGYRKVAYPGEAEKTEAFARDGQTAGTKAATEQTEGGRRKEGAALSEADADAEALREGAGAFLNSLKKGAVLSFSSFDIKEGETSPPKRYTSGSMILAMENAGQLIEDEELRAQIKGSGIGTSATRAEILKKLVNIQYLRLNEKTQVITPTMFGEMVNDVTEASIPKLLNPELTASWEKGLSYVAEGSVTEAEYMEKLVRFVSGRTLAVKTADSGYRMEQYLRRIPAYYKT